jgi:hypothetical protein
MQSSGACGRFSRRWRLDPLDELTHNDFLDRLRKAAEMSVGFRADVTFVDRSVKKLRELSAIFGSAGRAAGFA